MNAETWRRIDFAPDYEVSDRGRVRSYLNTRGRRVASRVIKGTRLRSGHIQVDLSTPLGSRRTYIHQLVARAFIGPAPDGMEVCHNDGNPANNDVRNLRYGTRRDNLLDSVRHGTHSQARKTHCPQSHPYDAENTYVGRGGERHCRTCARAATQRWRLRRTGAMQRSAAA